MIDVKTKSGFKMSLDEKLLEDQDMLDLIVASESEDESEKLKATKELYEFILGDDGYKALKDHVRKNNDGYCPARVLSAEFLELLNSSKEIKNS